ncbi:gp502 [Bacillus phage G]|uniref:Gp502 n=1 Tax=Bacillus phage G TaxID=2884420 RepID=G3MAP3_9CAUD|nr:gp502 [Bacillus phage G]AEO93760.1 gp502 [Bacillus phage G]
MKEIESYVVDCYADIEMIDFLLEVLPDYQNVLIERHQKFVNSYLKYKKKIRMVGVTYGYSDKDIKRIFWRVQRKLLLEFINRVDQNKLTISEAIKIPKNFDAFLMWQLRQFREDAETVFIYIRSKMIKKLNIDGVSVKRKDQITDVLKELYTIEDLQSVLPKKIYPIANDLLNGMSLTEVAKKYDRNLNYLIVSIVGVKNPRSKSERGWLAYLENDVDNRVIQFPVK